MFKLKMVNTMYRVGLLRLPTSFNNPLLSNMKSVIKHLITEQVKKELDTMVTHCQHIDELLRQEQYLADSRRDLECEIDEIRKTILLSITNKDLYGALLDIWYFDEIIIHKPGSVEDRYKRHVKRMLSEYGL